MVAAIAVTIGLLSVDIRRFITLPAHSASRA